MPDGGDTGRRAVDLVVNMSEDEVIERGRDAAGVLTQYARVGSRAVEALTRCRVIARYGTGVDIVDVDAATRRGVQVTNAPNEWCGEEVADHAVALRLAAARKICRYDRATRQGEWRWKTGQPIQRLRGRVLGLLSFGAIARLIAERARAFGVEVWACDPFIDEAEIRSRGVRPVSFDDLVEGADYPVVQSPLTPETHHTFDRPTLRRAACAFPRQRRDGRLPLVRPFAPYGPQTVRPFRPARDARTERTRSSRCSIQTRPSGRSTARTATSGWRIWA